MNRGAILKSVHKDALLQMILLNLPFNSLPIIAVSNDMQLPIRILR